MVYLGPSIENTGVGVRGCEYVGAFLPGHCVGRHDIWLRGTFGDPPHWEGPGGVPPLDGTTDRGE